MLVAVLVALVVLTLLASAIAVVSERAVAEAQADTDAFSAEVSEVGTRDAVMFLLNSQRQTFGGITVDDQMVWSAGQAVVLPADIAERGGQSPLPIGNEVRLDGSPYLGLGDVRFALQDDAGLLGVNWMSPMFRDRFFQQHGVDAAQGRALESARLDYQDPDSLFRLGGAEAGEYRRRDLPPPTNRPLVTPLQARQILGWNDLLSGLDDGALLSLLSVATVTVPNVNTAPSPVLRSIPGVDAETAARMVAMREQMPFSLPRQVIQAFALPLTEDDPLRLFAAESGTLKLWHNARGPVHLVHWTLTPIDEGGRPWRFDYEIILPRDQVTDTELARPTQTPFFTQPPAAGR